MRSAAGSVDSGSGGAGSVDAAHAQLRALGARGMRWPRPLAPQTGADRPPRRAAVLVLFGALDALPARTTRAAVARELDVLLVRRAESLTNHPGQVSFPGGAVDPGDADAVAAAVREAREETGLDPVGVETIGTLADLPLAVSNFVVTPVLAWWSRPSPVAVVDRGESSDVFRAPVADLLDPALRRSATLRFGGGEHRTPAFLVGEHVVWGFTAFVLDRLFDELGWTVPWDRDRVVDVT